MNRTSTLSAYLIGMTILLLYALTAHSQSTTRVSHTHNGLRHGDILTKHAISYTDTVSPGTERFWDLSDIPANSKRSLKVELTDDSLARHRIIDNRTAMYYDMSGDTIRFAGYENNLWKLIYDQSEIWLCPSMSYGSYATGPYHGRGVYNDNKRYYVSGSYHIDADATGTLIMPEGDTLRHVLRIHTVRRFVHRFCKLGEHEHDIAHADIDSAEANGNILIHDTRRWYATGYRYPLLETQTLMRPTDTQCLMRQACYTPVEEMEALPYDPDNVDLRQKLPHGTSESSSTDYAAPDLYPGGGDDVHYRFTQNRSDRSVSVDYSSEHSTDVQFILADVSGIVYSSDYRHCNPGEEYTVTLQYGNLPYAAHYMLYICTDSNRYVEKFYR